MKIDINAKALAAFMAVHDEIDRIDPDCKLDPMSPLAAELGGRSIAAWEAVTAALKAATEESPVSR